MFKDKWILLIHSVIQQIKLHLIIINNNIYHHRTLSQCGMRNITIGISELLYENV